MGPKQYSIREKIHVVQKHHQVLKDYEKDIFKTEETDYKIYYNTEENSTKEEGTGEEAKTSQLQHSIAACKQAQFQQMIVKLEIKIMNHDYNYLAVNLIKDNNSLPTPEKIEKDDFEIVMFSDKNNKKNSKENNN
ncbi:uncharacterized protein CIMG_13659 [Coccidioides immitis RS]|uniref:Uncharacterized protein n=1 Tax=Coccidioides immitis (strain RS) TaxID=246410 RepID=A0A0D8JYT4_COCIM|nr:uncharacterized protein CIMG_13659 [Coccidioides immitis RS]KJF61423.1 hypothetical protein CIMG_13659 [Coccidioides immitis RS]